MIQLPVSVPFRRVGLAAAFGLLLAASVEARQTEKFTFDADALAVGNLIGAIDVEPGNGSEFEVEVRVRGRDAQPGAVRFERRDGARAAFEVVFPVDRERRYVYPELEGSRTSFRLHDREGSSWLRELIEAVSSPEISVTGSGSGLELWADLTVRVPRGASLELRNGVGKVFAQGLDGDLRFDLIAGDFDGERLSGQLLVSTGSGPVTLTDIDGNLVVDTGSGHVKVARVKGPRVAIDTGSGRVVMEDVDTEELVVDTGSGGVRAERVRADGARVDTGSGSVVLALDSMGTGRFDVDTGSGSITLLVPQGASAEVSADTGSGGIQVDLASIETLHRERDEMKFRIGGGEARVRLDTGSGAIRVGPVD